MQENYEIETAKDLSSAIKDLFKDVLQKMMNAEDDLTIEYSGNEVVCNIQTLNEDGSIYLSEWSLKGTEVKDTSTEDGWYHYGKTSATAYQEYNIGDVITYNGMNFYVIENSDEASDRVTMLKAEPLTVDEVNAYGIDANGVNHINRYASILQGTAYNQNGYGAVAYYTSETCGYNGSSWVETGCTTDYEVSDVKYVVDAWANDKFSSDVLSEDATGYSARLLTYDELVSNMEYEWIQNNPTSLGFWDKTGNTPSWLYNENYIYWTMSIYEDSITQVLTVDVGGILSSNNVYAYNGLGDVVRPVVTILKSTI